MSNSQTLTAEETLLERLSDKKLNNNEILNVFKKTGLPSAKEENYKHSPVRRLIEKSLAGFGIQKSENFENSIVSSGMSTYVIVFQNGKLATDLTSINEKGLSVSFEKAFSREMSHAVLQDPFVYLNESFSEGKLRITVNKGAKIEGIVELVYHCVSLESNPVSLPSVELILEEGSSLELIENHIIAGDKDQLLFPVLKASIGKNARLTTSTLQTSGKSQITVSNTYIEQERDSYYKNLTVSTSGKFIRNNHSVILKGTNCESHLLGLTIGSGKDHIDHHTVVDHTMPHCFSNELYKGVLKDESTGVFNGRIYVRPDAQQTNAFQANNNVLLSEKASIHTKPQLEIWADDVKCSHGCTSGQLDDEALFYLKTRGVGEHQARLLLLKAFASQVISQVDNDQLKDHVLTIIDKNLS